MQHLGGEDVVTRHVRSRSHAKAVIYPALDIENVDIGDRIGSDSIARATTSPYHKEVAERTQLAPLSGIQKAQ